MAEQKYVVRILSHSLKKIAWFIFFRCVFFGLILAGQTDKGIFETNAFFPEPFEGDPAAVQIALHVRSPLEGKELAPGADHPRMVDARIVRKRGASPRVVKS